MSAVLQSIELSINDCGGVAALTPTALARENFRFAVLCVLGLLFLARHE